MTQLESVIGLEVHVELHTKTKLFCRCRTDFGAEPNTQVCPVCLGLPGGALPVLNQKALAYAVKASLALNCRIAKEITFDRKNYFYADLPKGYQISQFFQPVGTKGYVEIEVDGKVKKIAIRQLHLEEDTGKLIHLGGILSSPYSRVDFNRAGVPLIEIVTEPDIRSAEEARLFLQKLRDILRYIDISDCKMQEGSLRCDANVSVRPAGSDSLGNKTELKNMNSFRSVYQGIEYEINRQRELVMRGESVLPETRHWDEENEVTRAMRGKLASADYRCFPDPNIPPLKVNSSWVEQLADSIPELPDARLKRFVEDYGLPLRDAQLLTGSRELADFFEGTLAHYRQPKAVSNWIQGELLRLLNLENMGITSCKVKPQDLGRLLEMVDKGLISGKMAKAIWEEMFASGKGPETIVKEKGLVQISDENILGQIVAEVIQENPNSVKDYLGGKKKAIGFLVGQVMKKTKGQANPQLVNKLLRERLSGSS